jgi:hypothetical protein
MSAEQLEALKTISELQAKLDSIKADIKQLQKKQEELLNAE